MKNSFPYLDFKSNLDLIKDDGEFLDSFRNVDKYFLAKNDFSLETFVDFHTIIYNLIVSFFESIYEPDSIPTDDINVLTDYFLKLDSNYFESFITYYHENI